MKDLYKKYVTDHLTHQELEMLKNTDPSILDRELERFMEEEWQSDMLDSSNVSEELMVRVKSQLDEKIQLRRLSMPLYVKVFAWAAAVLLPLLILSTFYLYHENHQLVSEEMVVATGLGERATITLPDATKVTLNADSKLTYIPKVYNKKERKIKFSGEGYFEVSKDKERPFLIDAKGLNISVLGTTFDLLVRNNEKTAELSLESGKVMFRSLLSGKFVILNPNQKVVLDQSTGNLVVMKDEYQYVAPWKRNELVFRNAPLSSVLSSIEKTYGVHIVMGCKECNSDLFTGTLVTNDIIGVLEVIEEAYQLKAVMNGHEISIVKVK